MINLPEGVHYLGYEAYIGNYEFGPNLLGIIFLILLTIGFIIFFFGIYVNDKETIIAGVFGIILTGIVAIFALCHNPVYYTQYKVTIDNFVPFTVVQKDYKIAKIEENIIYLRPNQPVLWNGESD